MAAPPNVAADASSRRRDIGSERSTTPPKAAITGAVDIGADEFAFGVTIAIDGGTLQECSETGGANVSLQAVFFPPELNATVSWFIDGERVASGGQVDVFVEVGPHQVEVEAVADNGVVLPAISPLVVHDTIGPVIEARFVDLTSGEPLSTLPRRGNNRVGVDFAAVDICDTAPVVRATYGIPAQSGDELNIKRNKGRVTLIATEIELMVSAQDAAGNTTVMTTGLSVD